MLLDISAPKLPSTYQIVLEFSKTPSCQPQCFPPNLLIMPIVLKCVFPFHLSVQILELGFGKNAVILHKTSLQNEWLTSSY